MRSLIRFGGLVLFLSAPGCGDDGGSSGGSGTGTSSTSSTPADTNPPGPDDDGGQTPDPTPGNSLDSSGTGDEPATSSGDTTTGGEATTTGDATSTGDSTGDTTAGDTTAGDTTTGEGSTGGGQAVYGPCPGGEDDECADGEVCRTGSAAGVDWSMCTVACNSVKSCADPENDVCGDIPGDGEFSEWCGPVDGCSFGNPCPRDMTCVAGFQGNPDVCVWAD